MPINYPNLVAAIDAEISRLQLARKLLSGGIGMRDGKRVMSAEARALISAAQKKRRAQQKRATTK